MDAHLVRPPRLQPALDERVVAQLLDDAHVRDGVLALALRTAAAPAVAAVAHDPRLDACRLRPPADDGLIQPLRVVGAELPAQMALRLDVASEHHQTARLLVEPVNGAHLS